LAITPGLARALEAAALHEAATLKSRYVGRVQALLQLAVPALEPLELSAALGLDDPEKTRTSIIVRWLSTAPRNLRAMPDETMRALIDRLFEGLAVMAVGRTKDAHGLRPILFCEPWEADRLGPEWQLIEVAPTNDRPDLPRRTPRMNAERPLGEPPPEDLEPASVFDPSRPVIAKPRRILPNGVEIPPLGLGAMRFSTAPKDGQRPDEIVSVAILQRALDLGLRLIDTADSYALDDKDMHHNERLIRRAVGTWHSPDRDKVLIATKAGLTRPGGRWAPNGRPDHLKRACEQSLEALGVDALDLFQLHVKDIRVPFEDSLGALADLHREGKVRHLGVCNVNATDLQKAIAILPKGAFATVQNELNPFDSASARGVLALTREHGLTLLAHSPLGGHAGVHRVLKKDVLANIALRHGLNANDSGRHQIVLAWLLTLGPHVVPVFGATRQTSVESSFGALQLALTPDDIADLDEAFPNAAALRNEPLPALPEVAHEQLELVSTPLPPPGRDPEIVMILGIPGAGKSSLVKPYLDEGYLRLNRDLRGGKLDDLIPPLRNALASGHRRIILDNTYGTIKSRAPVIASGQAAHVPVRGLWLDTSLENAQWNVALRMLGRHDRLLSPEEIAAIAKQHPDTIPPVAQQTWLRNFEPPMMSEGFTQLEQRPFVRRPRPEHTHKAILLDVDGTLRMTRSGENYPRDAGDVMLKPRRRAVLEPFVANGYRLFFISNQSGISSGKVTSHQADLCFSRTIELLGLPVDDVVYCPHQAFPVSCFCRKPMPGLAVLLIERYGLSLSDLIIVGDMKSDAALAKALGVRYEDAAAFFGDPPEPAPKTTRRSR
jgi:histidinol-phosphate phosphatase family protein